MGSSGASNLQHDMGVLVKYLGHNNVIGDQNSEAGVLEALSSPSRWFLFVLLLLSCVYHIQFVLSAQDFWLRLGLLCGMLEDVNITKTSQGTRQDGISTRCIKLSDRASPGLAALAGPFQRHQPFTVMLTRSPTFGLEAIHE